jgi:hypothetical protein
MMSQRLPREGFLSSKSSKHIRYELRSNQVSYESHGTQANKELVEIPIEISPMGMGCKQILPWIEENTSVAIRLGV